MDEPSDSPGWVKVKNPPPRRARNVCHACGFKYPIESASVFDCCPDPEVHVHNISQPCDWCRD